MTVVLRLSFVFAVMLMGGLASPAWADWRKAETEHFIVYSNGGERQLRDYAIALERFHALLRARLGGGGDESLRKLSVYLVADDRQLRVTSPALPDGIAGYYWTSEIDTLAVLVRGRGNELLQHEYAHHFMAKDGAGRYPGWFNEGFAEYLATATVSARGSATLGMPQASRLAQLQQGRWMPMDALLRARGAFDVEERNTRGMYYAQSWLLTHWLAADGERLRRMGAYLTALNGGRDPVETWQATFGQTPDQLTEALRSYLRGRLYYAELNIPPISPEITLSRLSPAADEVMLPWLRFRRPGDISGSGDLLPTFRTAAERHPDDALALTALGQAEHTLGDANRALNALNRAIELEPENSEALALIGRIYDERADETDEETQSLALRRQSQGYLVRAMEADPTDYRVYAALARQRRTADTYPTDNDLTLWMTAVGYAPQVLSLRGEAALAMLEADKLDQALVLLAPIVNDPHGSSSAAWARDLMARIEQRRQAPASQD